MLIVTWEFESPPLHLIFKCGNSSVGRAQPCQGWGREFESRFPLIIEVIMNFVHSHLFFAHINRFSLNAQRCKVDATDRENQVAQIHHGIDKSHFFK